MQRLWSADSGLENLIYIVVAIVWFVIQIAAQNAKRRKRQLPPPTMPMGEPPPPPPSVLDPEEELRRFLKELSGESAPPPRPTPRAPPPTPSTAPPPPTFAPPPEIPPPPAATPPPIARPKPARPAVSRKRPAAPPPLPREEVVAAQTSERAADAVAPVSPTAPVSGLAFQGVAAFPIAASARRRRRRVSLPMGRSALRRAVLYQTLLGPPRALEPYR